MVNCDFLLRWKVLESGGVSLAELLLLVVKVSEHVVHHRALVHGFRPPPLSRGQSAPHRVASQPQHKISHLSLFSCSLASRSCSCSSSSSSSLASISLLFSSTLAAAPRFPCFFSSSALLCSASCPALLSRRSRPASRLPHSAVQQGRQGAAPGGHAPDRRLDHGRRPPLPLLEHPHVVTPAPRLVSRNEEFTQRYLFHLQPDDDRADVLEFVSELAGAQHGLQRTGWIPI